LANQPGINIPFYTVQLLTYLIQGDLDNARFLWRRIPKDIRNQQPEIGAAWDIGRQMWKKDYSNIYKAIKSFKGSELHKTLIEYLLETFRDRTFALLSTAYTYIGIADASNILGLSSKESIKFCTAKGWEYDKENKYFKPKPIVEKKVQTAGLEHLQSLTEYVVYLEN